MLVRSFGRSADSGAGTMVKERPSKDGEHVARQAGGHQKKRRLGGGGLSLAAFAAAKSKPKIAPSQIRRFFFPHI